MKKLFCVILATVFIGCATAKTVGHTVNDIASALCIVFADEHDEELDGLSPEKWCAAHENLQPFISYILSAKQAAGNQALGNKSD